MTKAKVEDKSTHVTITVLQIEKFYQNSFSISRKEGIMLITGVTELNDETALQSIIIAKQFGHYKNNIVYVNNIRDYSYLKMLKQKHNLKFKLKKSNIL